MKLSEDPNIPLLLDNEHPGQRWVNITEAAELLGITRQHSYKRAKSGGYKSLHKVGNQPAYVVSTAEINEILDERTKREQERAAKAAESVEESVAS